MPRNPNIPVKALTYLHPGAKPAFTYFEIPKPIPENKILIDVKAAALNPIDIHLLNSSLTWPFPGEKGLGRDFSGVVEQIGAKVRTDLEVGDRVCGMYLHIGGYGTLASKILINPNSDSLCKMPDNLTYEEAAGIPLTFGTAFRCLSHAKLDQESNVCILGGTTSVGLFAIQLAKNYYNVNAVVVTASPRSAQLALDAGADRVIDYKSTDDLAADIIQGLDATSVHDVSAPKQSGKFNIVIDCIGGTEVLNKWTQVLEPKSQGSAYVTIVGDQKSEANSIGGTAQYLTSPGMLGRKLFGGFRGLNYIVESVGPGPWINEIPELFLSDRIRVFIDTVCDWRDWEPAFEKLKSKKAHGKIVLLVEDF